MVITLVGLQMVGVMTRQTMRAAILMEVTVVDQMLTPNTVQNVFVINKHRMIIQVAVCLRNLTTMYNISTYSFHGN